MVNQTGERKSKNYVRYFCLGFAGVALLCLCFVLAVALIYSAARSSESTTITQAISGSPVIELKLASPTLVDTLTTSPSPMIPVTSTSTLVPTITITPTITFTPSKTLTPTTAYTPTITLTFTPTLPSILGTDCLPNDNRQYAKVTRVIDGDTIEVVIQGQAFRVRYIGMDTPENTSSVEYFGPEATYRNRLLVDGKTVILIRDVSETDRYDRLLRYVIADNVFVNYELVRQGYASVATYPPDVACRENFLVAESYARQKLLGFWAPTPIPSSSGGGTGGSGGGGTDCNPAYPDVCLQDGIGDWDCAGGSGNGPNYVQGPIRVLPPDPFGLDRDGDGWGCE